MHHDNCPNCFPGRPCSRHEIIGDGKRVTVPLMMMDGMPPEVREMLQRGQRALDEANGKPRDSLDAYYDSLVAECEKRQQSGRIPAPAQLSVSDSVILAQKLMRDGGSVADKAYAEMCADLQRGGRA